MIEQNIQAGGYRSAFAVVADEVRGLAQRSAEAAREISGLVGETKSKVNELASSLSELEDKSSRAA